MLGVLKKWMSHPLTRGADIDDPATTHLRCKIVREKKFLRKIYKEWYTKLAADVPARDGHVVELGSGAGFLDRYIPGLITSDVFPCPGVDMVLDARELPFRDGSLRAIVMTNVLHHIAECRRFFAAATRCVRPGGVIAMIEPWVTPWSRMIYTGLHHEPFAPGAVDWDFPVSGPLSAANGALPWILFVRDRQEFLREFPEWRIERIESIMPFRYLVSGGVSLRSLAPAWSYRLWRGLEKALGPWRDHLAMFAHIVLRRLESAHRDRHPDR